MNVPRRPQFEKAFIPDLQNTFVMLFSNSSIKQ